jgi:hypothetical protein
VGAGHWRKGGRPGKQNNQSIDSRFGVQASFTAMIAYRIFISSNPTPPTRKYLEESQELIRFLEAH